MSVIQNLAFKGREVNQNMFDLGHRDPDFGNRRSSAQELKLSKHSASGGMEVQVISAGHEQGDCSKNQPP